MILSDFNLEITTNFATTAEPQIFGRQRDFDMNSMIALSHDQYNIRIQANLRAYCGAEKIEEPIVDSTAYIHPLATVDGNVLSGKQLMVQPTPSLLGDEVELMWIGDDVNMRDCVLIHDVLRSYQNGEFLKEAIVEANGKLDEVYIDKPVSLAHQCQAQVRAKFGHYTFVGMQSTREKSDSLSAIASTYPVNSLNNAVVHVNQELAIGYQHEENQTAQAA